MVSARPAMHHELGIFTGKVKSFNMKTGYGFIECPSLKSQGYQDVFLHTSQLQQFVVGNSVRFTAYLSSKGHPQAKDLQLDGASPPSTVNLGTFTGVVKSFFPDKGYGFISSAKLRAQGYEMDTFLHHSQLSRFQTGSVVRFEAYLDVKGRLKARHLQSADTDDFRVGALVVARQALQALCGGYLSLEVGLELEVLYIGSTHDAEESGWLYAQRCADGSEGWVPCHAVELNDGRSGGGRVSNEDNQVAPLEAVSPSEPAMNTNQHVAISNALAYGTGATAQAESFGHADEVPAAADAQTPPPRCPPPGRPCPEVIANCHLDTSQEPLDDCLERPTCGLQRNFGAVAPRGVELLGASAPAGTDWRYPLYDVDRNAFVGHAAGAVAEARAQHLLAVVMNGLDELCWDRPANGLGAMSRGTKWMVRSGCQCPYRYGGVTVQPVSFPPWMQEVLQACMPACGLPENASWPNSCNLNCYADGSDGVDWHADDEPLFQGTNGNCRIISLSLGETRTFEVRLRDEAGSGGCQIRLRSGDLCTMEGLVQRHYVHRVPKASGKHLRLRLNLTWRWIVVHDPRRCGL